MQISLKLLLTKFVVSFTHNTQTENLVYSFPFRNTLAALVYFTYAGKKKIHANLYYLCLSHFTTGNYELAYGIGSMKFLYE